MHPVEQAPAGQDLDVPAGGDGGDPEAFGQFGDAGGAALAHQGQQSVVSFGGTLAHGVFPLAVVVIRRPQGGPGGSGSPTLAQK
ncbi:hypothetical protein GCM10010222_07770 [Streptomyces tanashiensis]|nr:hypothetical protein GCM10010222_07770 [Streptomyces tanashiensis]